MEGNRETQHQLAYLNGEDADSVRIIQSIASARYSASRSPEEILEIYFIICAINKQSNNRPTGNVSAF